MEGLNLREARLAANLTGVEVARKIGVCPATITSWETGKSKPNNAEMYCLCLLYGIETGDIFLP